MKATKTTAAFQTWGQTGVSALHTGADAEAFAQAHNESGTFATLHTFASAEEAELAHEAALEWAAQQ